MEKVEEIHDHKHLPFKFIVEQGSMRETIFSMSVWGAPSKSKPV